MLAFKNILSAIADLLDEAKNHGLIKEFSLVELSSETNHKDVAGANQLISNFLERINGISVEESQVKKNIVQIQRDGNEVEESQVKKYIVQIQRDGNEMKRRIESFISEKRKEIDKSNVEEFCGRDYIEQQDPRWEAINTCARVDAVCFTRSGGKSRVKVSKVENRWGPQTHLQSGIKKIKQEPSEESESQPTEATFEAIEERLQSMELHSKIKTDTSLRRNIFERLKDLEDKILFLEGISPEYFHLSGTGFSSPKKFGLSENEKMYSMWSSDDFQKRYKNLKDSLMVKMLERAS